VNHNDPLPPYPLNAYRGLDLSARHRAAHQLQFDGVMQTPRTPTVPQAFELVTFGKGGRFSRHNIDKTSALLEADDLERFASGR
jgi:hypothetical protein